MSRNQIRFDIQRTEPLCGGMSFGDTGAYQRLYGRVHFAIDPEEPGLPYICDLDLAPRNADGLVEFSATLDLLKPVDAAKGNRRLFYEFSNRGGRGAMRFNDGVGADMSDPKFAGNGFLLREGYTIMWSGWQGDLIDQGSNVVAYLPEATQGGLPLRGMIRQEFIAAAKNVLSIGVSAGAEGGANVHPYPVIDRSTATLTVRRRERDQRVPVPADGWELAKAELKDGQVVLTPSNIHLHVKGGFKPGHIYEFIYETEGSRVMGLGFLGIRDLMAAIKFAQADSAGNPNPLAGSIDKVYGYGASLSGRVIREYVYEGWNQDTDGRKLFDAVQTHTGSGRLFHNQRFAQVGRYPRQHEEHSWPSEKYPFTFVALPDPFTERSEGLLQRPDTDPLFMHTHTSSDYWIRHVSLNHTDARDGSDAEIPDTVRMYEMAGAPHMSRPVGDPAWIGAITPNSISPAPYLRACLSLMDRWATDGTPPPATNLPSKAAGTLTSPEAVLAKFPKIPGVQLPEGASQMPNYDYGADYDRGYPSVFPPEPIAGQNYPIQVPDIDADGNDIAGLRYPDIEAPVGSYLGWALRAEEFSGPDLLWTTGSFVPFARTKAQRQASGDPRPSIEERYQDHADYVSRVAAVCARLVPQGLLLQEDADRFVTVAKAKNPFDPAVALNALLPVPLGGGPAMG